MPKLQILCISFDRVVSENRCSSLEDAGYEVTAVTSINEGLELLSRQKFDAVILGHRFSAEEKYVLAVDAKGKNTPVVLVCGATSDSEIPATRRVYALEGNAGLLSELSELLAAAARPKAVA